MDRTKLIKMFAVLTAIVVLAVLLSKAASRNSMTLTEHEKQLSQSQTQTAVPQEDGANTDGDTAQTSPAAEGPAASPENADRSEPDETPAPEENAGTTSLLTGALLNGTSQEKQRHTLAEGFYYEPVSDSLRRYITGFSYPSQAEEAQPEITVEELRYVHILHYDFDGKPAEGELICNRDIAQDLTEIFYELYRNEYRLERVLLIDEYDGDDDASMADNNTSCFNYRVVEGTDTLSRHAFGLAVDVNPFYNPYVTYNNRSRSIFPPEAEEYADRSAEFPYKIDENDLCYKLFTEHGFIWGGNWNNSKDYQHFEKKRN